MISLEGSFYRAKRKINTCDSDILDLVDIRFFTPTMLLLVLNYSKMENIKTIRVNKQTGNYVKRVLGLIPSTSTTLPFKELPLIRDTVNGDVSNIMGLLDGNYGGKQTLFHLLDEMITNIYDHSQFTSAYTLSQMYPRVGFTEMSFFDNGVSIPGRFELAGIEFEDDCDAIRQCINGKSTCDDVERGYGINTSVRLVTEGNGGEILIASRNGLYKVTSSGAKMVHLNPQRTMDGTLISIRVRRNPVQKFYKYMETKEDVLQEV